MRRRSHGRGLRNGVLAVGVVVVELLLPFLAHGQRPRVETFSVDSGLPSADIIDLEQDPSGRLWILSRRGVTVYDGREFQSFGNAHGLPTTILGALEVAPDGEVWTVSRAGANVYHLRDGFWRPLPLPGVDDEIFNWAIALESIVLEGRRFLVVGTTEEGVWLWNGDRWTHQDTEAGLQVTDVEVLGDEVMIATLDGLCVTTPRRLDCGIRELHPRLREVLVALHPDDSTGRLWIAGDDWVGFLENGSLTEIETEPFELVTTAMPFFGAMAVDAQGGLYFGAALRLFFHDPDGGGLHELGRPEGLAGEGTTALLLDREADMWIGSVRGLSKIESRRFLSYDREHGLLDAEVSALLEIAPGRILVGHDLGLTVLGGDAPTTVGLAEQQARDSEPRRILDMALDRDGDVWLAAHGMGLLRLREEPASGTWRTDRFELERDLDPYSVEVDARGTLWVAAVGVLFRRDGERFEVVEMGIETDDAGMFRWLETAPDGRVYVGTRRGLLWYDGERWRRSRGATEEADNVFSVLAEDPETVWVGTDQGLYELRGDELTKVRRGALEIDHPVYLTLQDDAGRLWLGTDDGVFVWDGEDLRHLTVRHGLAGRETNRGAGLLDHRGRVWIGTDQGLSVYNERYDRGPAAAPHVAVAAIEVAGEKRSPARRLDLPHYRNTLTFHVETIAFSREEPVLYRYRLEGFDRDWQAPAPLAGAEIRYTNVPPGDYRFRIEAGWPGGPWSGETVTAAIVIARPLWRRPWFVGLGIATGALLLLGGHALRTRSMRARNVALATLNDQLNAAVAERQRLIGELEKKNAELERFAYTVSHDLKSPLFTVQGFLGLLEKDAAGGDLDRVRRDVAEIKRAADKMGRLLNELLELSRIGHVVHPSEAVDLGELAREAVSETLSMNGRRVHVSIARDLPVVRGDRIRLQEVLQNLVENAVKYLGDQPRPRIEIGMRHDGGERVIYVRDNGIGIEPRYHEKIFGLFERLEQETEGTGVGLALVKRIVEFHGGHVWVESEGRGRGSTFCLTLPGVVEGDGAP